MLRNKDGTFTATDARDALLAIGSEEEGLTFAQWAGMYVLELLEDEG